MLRLSRGGIIGPDAYSDDAMKVLPNDLTVARGIVAVNRSGIAVYTGECADSPCRYSLGEKGFSYGPCPPRPYLLQQPCFAGTRVFKAFRPPRMRSWRNW